MFYDNLVELCKSRNVKITNVVTALGCSQGSLSTWKNGATPRADTLKKFADFFNVSVDVLVKGVEVASNQPDVFAGISEAKREFIALILTLDDEQVKKLRRLTQVALDL